MRPDVHALVLRRMDQHGVRASGWTFGVDKAVTRAGCCHFACRRITLSRHLIDGRHPLAAVDNILLHEIAHALAGFAAGHGPAWRAIATSIGCDGSRCHSLELVPAPLAITCKSCGKVAKLRHRAHRSMMRRLKCIYCFRRGCMDAVRRGVVGHEAFFRT